MNALSAPTFPNYPVQLPKTGQTKSYAAGDDGDLQRGVAWPNPRFTDNIDGTIIDNLTGLMWTKNANLAKRGDWLKVLNYVAGMNAGTNPNYGYTDWHLPNKKELRSLIDYSEYKPALPIGRPFTDVESSESCFYWSSSTNAYNTSYAWIVHMWYGYVFNYLKGNNDGYVWPVRAGQ